MNLIVWLLAGSLLGGVASLLMAGASEGEQGMLLQVLVGIVGAAVGGWLVAPLVGVATIDQGALSVGALILSMLGAVLLLVVVQQLHRGER